MTSLAGISTTILENKLKLWKVSMKTYGRTIFLANKMRRKHNFCKYYSKRFYPIFPNSQQRRNFKLIKTCGNRGRISDTVSLSFNFLYRTDTVLSRKKLYTKRRERSDLLWIRVYRRMAKIQLSKWHTFILNNSPRDPFSSVFFESDTRSIWMDFR